MATKENEVALRSINDNKLNFTDREIETIKNTVAKEANDDELRMFLHIAKTYGLDPFNKEIFFWKVDGDPTIMTSRDGYLKIANRNKNFDGLVSDVVRKNDKFVKHMNSVEHEYGTERGDIIGAYAFVYRKDRKYPTYSFAPFEEYNAGTKVWNSYPSAMILKVAESMALKRAFSVSGLVSREEMDMIQKESYNNDKNPQNCSQTRDIEVVNDLSKREKEIKQIIGNKKDIKEDLFSYLKYAKEESDLNGNDKFGINDLSDNQYRELKELLLSEQ